ncbi:cell wall hydrolase [Microvirga sp. SRT01]|jgi:spore germination cell wall hydrolase CwlJ-like protein|uniref:Cell wall hydrolase n=1 Tax=Sphingomonas longa TaxID=2778730 RepID=A0ABS2D7L5_9SPHN|nr:MULTISPECIES: cell wall hydrolase [Alphaproteobacteria]MBM6576927.1 cell wall hydrolase [Sphingomonas sp. BT552]MBR7709971.1 cell wall hydrolase [Microvirga sp. SRT01]
MTVFARFATAATMSLALAGLLGTSTPTLAQEVQTSVAVSAPAVESTVEQTAPVETATTDSFDTLADAVDAHDDNATASTSAMRCLAGAIYFESKGEPLSGQLAVAQVILNRVKSGRFPTDVCAVVKQRGQFGFVRGGEIPAVNEGARSWRTAIAVARVAMADMWKAAAPKALYFNTPGRLPGSGLTKIAAIGNHIFYR